jgi:lipopolysaccharide export system protein LptA
VAPGSAKVVSAGSGNVVTASMSRPQSKPPFSPDDVDDESIVEEASSDGFELTEKEAQGAETQGTEAQGKQESLIVGRPAGSLDIEMSSPSETPMVSLFGMAGGAGAAAMTADPLAPTVGGREAVPGGSESAVGAPVPLPPSESSRVLPASPASALPELSTSEVSEVSEAQPKAVASAEGAALGKITFSRPEDEFSAAPSPVEITTPMSSQDSVLTASWSAPDEVPAMSAPPVETTAVPLREETASMAGAETLVVAEQLDEPVVDAAVVGEGSPGKGRVRATVSSLEREAWPVGREGVSHVVATSLQADGALRSEVSGAPALAEETPVRMALPPAPDQLVPQRAERTGAAFEVPAAAGDLVIAANSQTDFEVKEKRVVFSGSVIMKNERFYLTADTLVAHLKDNQSGLDFAEAQGNVVVRMVENGRETGSSGLAKTAIFRPETGEIVLKGWPQLRMGNKAHVASAATTEMSLFTDGRMKTSGRNQTMIVP